MLRKALVLLPDGLFAIRALQAPNGKVTLTHLLEMLDERLIDGSAAGRTDDRNGWSRELLRHHHSKAGCDHDEKYDLGDSHGGGGDRSTLII